MPEFTSVFAKLLTYSADFPPILFYVSQHEIKTDPVFLVLLWMIHLVGYSRQKKNIYICKL